MQVLIQPSNQKNLTYPSISGGWNNLLWKHVQHLHYCCASGHYFVLTGYIALGSKSFSCPLLATQILI